MMDKTKPRILIVDDEEDLLMLMQSFLSREGYIVDLCLNGRTLMECIRENNPSIILLDIRMQGADGEEICHSLKSNEETKHIPIIIFSANHDIENIANSCGADDYLLKPFDAAVAKEKFKRVLQKKNRPASR